MPWLMPSMLSSTDAPVVVKPDIASKNASDNPTALVQNRNGIMPNTENTTHTIAVSRYPSRLPMWMDIGCENRAKAVPVASVSAAVAAKGSQSDSP